MQGGSRTRFISPLREWVSRTALRLYTATVLIAILPVGLFFYYTARLLREQAERRALQTNMQMAQLSARFLEDHFSQNKNFLQSYATDPRFRQDWERRDLKSIQFEMDRAHALQPDIAHVSTYTLDGTMNTTAPFDPKVIGQNFAFRDWYKGAMRTHAPYVSEVFRGRAGQQELSVAVAALISDSRGNTVGIMTAGYSLRRISQWLNEVSSYGNCTISVVDQNGHLLAGPSIDVSRDPIDLGAYLPVHRVMRGASEAGLVR